MEYLQKIEQREKLFGVIIVLLLIVCASFYFSMSKRSNDILDSERQQNQFVSSGLSIETNILWLRKLEREFMLRKDIEIQQKFELAANEVFEEVQIQWFDQGEYSIESLYQKIQDYYYSVKYLFELQIEKGLDKSKGLEGQLREAVHKIETKIREKNDDRILVELIYLRRYEKDFMLRVDEASISKFDERLEKIQTLIEATNWSKDFKFSLAQELRFYNQKFKAWVDIRLKLRELIRETDRAFFSIEKDVVALIRDYVGKAEQAAFEGNNNRIKSKLFFVLFGVLGLIGTGLLISIIFRQKKLAAQIEEIAHIDALTSLPNRRKFFQQLDRKLFLSTRTRMYLSLGLIDLDGFKAVNDIHGHGVGDLLLQAVSQRLRKTLGYEVILARLGGDEFGIIVCSKKSKQELLEIGNAICLALKQPFQLNDIVARIGGSVGFVQYPEVGDTSESLFEYADFALYHAKQNLKGTPVIFSSNHALEINAKRQLEKCLLEADLAAELDVYFQPIVDSLDGKVMGMEALARWHSPVMGVVLPDRFISAAEGLGIVGDLTSILLRKSLKVANTWSNSIYLSFNLSAIDIASQETALKLMAIIMDSGFPPNRIVFEITETNMMLNFQHANEVLEPFRKMGVEIALDDFGTGYSSLSYIQKMPIDRLKIDRAFISEIETRKTTRDIMATVVELCKSLEIICIVEGVETYKQLETVEILGCRLIQGYYFSKPLCAADAQKFLDERSVSSINDWQCIV